MQRSLIVQARNAIVFVIVTTACSGGGGGSGGPTDPGSTTGSLKVDVTTTGTELDPDGYIVGVGSQTQSVAANGVVTITGLAAGPYDVTLDGVAPNCSMPTSGSRRVTNYRRTNRTT